MSSRDLYQAVTQAVKVLQLGDITGPASADTTELIMSRTRGGL